MLSTAKPHTGERHAPARRLRATGASIYTMEWLRSSNLRRLVVGFCLILGIASWQASAADEVYVDHKHCSSHSGDHYHHGGGDNADGHHHCPSCSAHFVALTSTALMASAVPLDTDQSFPTNRSLPHSEAPPTPPPNI